MLKRIISIVLVAFCLIPAIQTSAQPDSELERIEPPFWWIGMENSSLQLLVYGKDIARSSPSIDYPGVKMKQVIQVENPNYLFLKLEIAPNAKAGSFDIKFEKRGDKNLTHQYTLRKRDTDRTGAQGFTSEDIIYLMMPDRFANGNPDNDSFPDMLEGVDRDDPNARHGGDIAGLVEHLDYIKEAGMTAIWFTPMFQNDMPPEYGAYHGYAATDMYKVDRRFGTNKEFLNMVELCHQKDMKVIMDMIHNHVGSEHWFVQDPPTGDWVHDREENGITNYRGAVWSDPYASEADLNQLEKGWFVDAMPDLNQDNPLLRTYLIQNTLWWIEYSGIDGIRMDTYVYPDKHYMAEWAEQVLNEYPDFNIVGEAWVNTVAHEAYWQRDKHKKDDDYNSHLPSVTDFPMQSAIRDAFNEDFGWTSGLSNLYYTLAQDYLYDDPFLNVIFLDNHDLTRFFTQIGEDKAYFKMAYAFLMTTRGIPQVYYGTELMFANKDVEGDGAKRADMPGGWPGDERSVFTEEGRTQTENEIFNYVKKLNHWRQDQEVIHSGKLTQFIPEDQTYVFFRHNKNKAVMVAMNTAEKSKPLDTGRFDEILKNYSRGKDVISDKTYSLEEELSIPAKTTLVLELN